MFNRGEVNGVEVEILKSNNPGPSQGEYHKQQVISEFPVASFSKRGLVLILSYENEISFTCRLKSFSHE